jgi:hypothetical protein
MSWRGAQQSLPLHCKGATSCFLDKLSEGTCCKSPDAKELENPQITQIFADSRGREAGESKGEGGLMLAVVSPISPLPFLRKSAQIGKICGQLVLGLRPMAAL